MYDIEMPYPCPLKITAGKDGAVELSNTGKVPLHDLVLYRSDHGSWRKGVVGELALFNLPAAATQPSTQPTTAPGMTKGDVPLLKRGTSPFSPASPPL